MPLSRGFLHHQLNVRPHRSRITDAFMRCLIGTAIFTLALGISRMFMELNALFSLAAGTALLLTAVTVTILGPDRLGAPKHNADLAALSRYGPPDDVVHKIEAELAEPGEMVVLTRLGEDGILGRELPAKPGPGDLILTRSWLLYFPAGAVWRLKILAVDQIVLVYRGTVQLFIGDRLQNPALAVIAVDRHGVGCEITASPVGLTRVMAELLSRVPWALDSFDAETERQWTEDRQQIVASVERRRESVSRGEQAAHPEKPDTLQFPP